MDVKKYTSANREAWNEVTPIHQKARDVDYKIEFAKPGYSTLDETITSKLNEIGIKGKDVGQLCCNNGRETLSMVNLGAKSGIGFDISDEAIVEASSLAKISGLDCRFIRTDVYDIDESYYNKFDLILITIGALYWLPDLVKFFGIVSKMLREDGTLVIYEEHPFCNMLSFEGEPEFEPDNPLKIHFSYFKDEPWVENDGIDYIGKSKYDSKTNYGWSYKISDIINPIASNGFRIKEFNEYRTDISSEFDHLNEETKVPLSYILVANNQFG
ncbi:MAG: class I SAM-dependent methyltransferase [Candidatus Zixiibacteriota bacterium]